MPKRSRTKIVLSFILLLTVAFFLSGCGEGTAKKTLVLGEPDWDSVRFHNEVARIIIEEGYGYPTETMAASMSSVFLGLRQGDIDIEMEIWVDNLGETYTEAVEAGEIIETSVNFDDAPQGYYVPTYVIEGDPERGIEPMAPDLKSVFDLPKYWELFKDPENPDKGRLYGCIPGWVLDEVMRAKHETYGLDEYFIYFSPGSDAALATSIVNAVEKGEPWVGYYWEPTWITGKYDLTLLEEPPYDPELYTPENKYACATPMARVVTAVNSNLPNTAPEVVEFLQNYQTSSALTSEALAYMQENNASAYDAAKWFLKEKEDVWTQRVPEDIAQKVKESL